MNNLLFEFYEKFKELDVLLKKILKEEKNIKDDILIKKGFIIKAYSLNYAAINPDVLTKLRAELKKIRDREDYLQEEFIKNKGMFDQIEKGYYVISKRRLHINLLPKYLKEALYYSNLMITRIEQLTTMLKEGLRRNKKSLGKNTEIFFASFEHIANKLLVFIHLLEQMSNKVLNFEKEAYYPQPRTYGRVMALNEFKKTIKSKCLSSSKNPTPVFDAPVSVRIRIGMMSKDQMKNFFRWVGVAGGYYIIFFQTKLKPLNPKPIPQTNGLWEYKFPKGMGIEILKAA